MGAFIIFAASSPSSNECRRAIDDTHATLAKQCRNDVRSATAPLHSQIAKLETEAADASRRTAELSFDGDVKIKTELAYEKLVSIALKAYEVPLISDDPLDIDGDGRISSDEAMAHAALKEARATGVADDLLFGSSPITLSETLVDEILDMYDFSGRQTTSASKPLAQLAETFSALGSGFKYTRRNNDGTVKHWSGLYVKPAALRAWLSIANERGYDSMRVVMHGSDVQRLGSASAAL